MSSDPPITPHGKRQRVKADADSSESPDSRMIDAEEASQSKVKESSQVTTSGSMYIANEDTEMANSDGDIEEVNLMKQNILQKWTKDDTETVKECLTISDGETGKFPNEKTINLRPRDLICDAVVAAFEGNRHRILEAESTNNKTATALAKASLQFLRKEQPKRLKVEDELSLLAFLVILCVDVVKEFFERRSKTQTQSEHKNMKTNGDLEDQLVNLFHESLQKHKDPNTVVSNFCKHLNDQIVLWRQVDTFYAGYTVLFQSSGMGKTHLVFSSLKYKIFGVYLCFRRTSDKKTYPPRSPVMDWLIKEEVDDANDMPLFQSSATEGGTLPRTTRHMLRFLAVMLATEELFDSWFQKWKKEKEKTPTPEDWFNHQKGGEKTDFLVFQNTLMSCADKVWKERRFEERAVSKDGFENNFVFFIDEGRTLLEENIFRDVRRCFCKGFFKSKMKVFAVFTDTLSTLTNFAPARHLDSSARAMSINHGNLLPPFYFVNFLDLFVDSEKPNSLSKYGRPLWNAYESFLQKSIQQLTTPGLHQFARFKLLRSQLSLIELKGDHQKAAAIACLACRAALRIHPGRRFASELVGGHMAVCSHVYKDREAILIDYPSEPLLAQASSDALLGPEADFSGWNVSLKQLQLAIQEADVDTGRIGELIHRLLLLLAMDMAKMDMASGSKYQGVSAYDFLKVLVGDSIDERLDGTQIGELKTKYVWFNHFLPLYYVPDAGMFQQIARRRAAIVCKPGQNGIDHEIPLMDSAYSKVVGSLAIQTKNVASKHDSDYPTSAGWKLGKEFALHGSDRDGSDCASDFYYFALYHNIGYQRSNGMESFEYEPIPRSTDAHQWTHAKVLTDCYSPIGLKMVGLDLPLFQSANKKLRPNVTEVQKSLKQMRDQGRSPIAHFTDELKKNIQELTPLAYDTV